MRDAAYIRYLETLVLSAIANLTENDDLTKIDEPEISYSVYNIRECINLHRKARAGEPDGRGVIPDPLHTLTMIGSTSYYDAFLDVTEDEAVELYLKDNPDEVNVKPVTFTFKQRFVVYDAWSNPDKDY